MLQTKHIRRIALALLLMLFSGVNFAANMAQNAELSARNNGSTPQSEPADDNDAAAPSISLWSTLALSYADLRHHYREPDPLGRVNPLDSETGSVPTTQATLRWRGQLLQALPELTLQAQVSHAQGQTAYKGYLQTGGTLTPYRSRTGNTLQALSLRVGLPLNAFSPQFLGQHIAPYVERSWQHWQRNLTQYSETFSWQTTTLGVMAIWPVAELGLPQFARFSLEADLAAGRSRHVRMAAPALGFATELNATGKQSAALALHYAIKPAWQFGLCYAAQRSNFAASPSLAGLQYPGSSNNEQRLVVSLDYHY